MKVARIIENVLPANGQYSGAPQRDFAGLDAIFRSRKTMYAELAPIARKKNDCFENLATRLPE